MIRIQEIVDKVAASHKDADISLIQRAYVYAAAGHAGQTRLSGEPYLSHPLAVADLLAEMHFDEATVAAGLLHDTVEDTDAGIEDIDREFGEEVADIVDGVTKISQMTFDSKEEAQAENIRKMILAMSHDIRVLMVKLADRLHNMRTLDFQKSHKQQSIAQETLDIYAPLANRLGLHRIKLELEDLGLRYTKPDVFAQITDWLDENQMVERNLIDKVIARIREVLDANGIEGEVRGRIKHKSSIYKKMTQQGLALDEMHDIIAFRVIVADLRDCYAVLGLMHAQWKPVHGRFKDYISMPKANGYQSLHTTVIGPEGERIEIQIRTREMHRMAEHGVASHWLYKDAGRVNPRDVAQFTWLREILDRQKHEADSKEFMHSLRLDLFKDEVYVFTPRGDVKELPEGATPIDFAYLIHSQVGDHCAGAKVNGKLVPLGTPLVSGDTIEVITDTNRHPSRDWLKIVKTAKARSRIQHFIRTEERARSISLGREMLEKEGRRMGINVSKAIREGDFDPVVKEFSLGSVDDLLSSVGYARHTPKRILRRLQAHIAPPAPEEVKAQEPAPTAPPDRKSESVSIRGVDDVLVRFARCCNPVPGDAIVGYISRGRGVTVHTSDCPNVQGMEPERLISVFWDGHEDKPFPARIHLLCRNEKGVLAQISALLAEANINIDSGTMHSLVDGHSEVELMVEVRDVAHLYHTMDRLRKLPAVLEVIRAAAHME
ncbi:MAG TPA: GTP pyrophosphokinase [Desulfovibrio sp.]|jgi:GTP pyrophosphokinase|uniref:RelA/SpoT family protein n=1 Tax=Nitratidesulfovibrio vulgaris TaxID=881 RepID=UPI000E8BEA55|nr:bifunctional (p)ppGpp synthetase/guanosine-3',5'-bis(diphosphate) 3'-pyrophosphohydrolase [Nitratidesulfovibrio vulgaris]WCB45608.1 bifunctional (p)ppGpp synthetase/guanosine-3',5'-bis(diphosphate) 3'-pyrophosphohydrolase [Nitratidesulfovibrio vulgaris]HBW16768.1 GTP pyrophosphokinase [Desulfovibrio sp.]